MQEIHNKLTTVLNEHAPVQIKTISNTAKVPWHNKEIKKVKEVKRKSEAK